MCLLVFVCSCFLGNGPRCEKRKPASIQVPCQILSGRCCWRTNSRYYFAAVLPPSQEWHSIRWNLLSSGDFSASGFLCGPGQTWRLQQVESFAWIFDQRPAFASTVWKLAYLLDRQNITSISCYMSNFVLFKIVHLINSNNFA